MPIVGKRGDKQIRIPDGMHDACLVYAKNHPELGLNGVPAVVRFAVQNLLQREAAQGSSTSSEGEPNTARH